MSVFLYRPRAFYCNIFRIVVVSGLTGGFHHTSMGKSQRAKTWSGYGRNGLVIRQDIK